jgi:hypothetical protein
MAKAYADYKAAAADIYIETGKVVNIAILHDLKATSITQAELERVSRYEQERSDCID